MHEEMMGKFAEDIITHFHGTITGYAYYISGCNQALIVPQANDGKVPEGAWFDVQRIKISDGPAISLDNTKTPGPDSSPDRNI